MYVFDKSILKSFNNVYQKKIILKTHLFIKNILGSLQNLFQCNKNLSKHQTKINTTIKLTYYKRTESSKVQFITKNKLKIVYKSICVQEQSSRGVLQKDVLQTRSNPQENNHGEERSQQTTKMLCNFIEITTTHGCVPRKFTTHKQNTFL